MVRVKDLTELTLEERWDEIKPRKLNAAKVLMAVSSSARIAGGARHGWRWRALPLTIRRGLGNVFSTNQRFGGQRGSQPG